MNFANFRLWEVYPGMVIDGQYINMTQLAGKERIFNNLSKLIEQNLISTTWPL